MDRIEQINNKLVKELQEDIKNLFPEEINTGYKLTNSDTKEWPVILKGVKYVAELLDNIFNGFPEDRNDPEVSKILDDIIQNKDLTYLTFDYSKVDEEIKSSADALWTIIKFEILPVARNKILYVSTTSNFNDEKFIKSTDREGLMKVLEQEVRLRKK